MACSQCGVCCKLFAINLTKEEYFSGYFDTQFKDFELGKDFDHVQECGGNIISQKKDGSCVYHKDKLCSIHQTRPQACREFCCDTVFNKYTEMVKLINTVKISGGV